MSSVPELMPADLQELTAMDRKVHPDEKVWQLRESDHEVTGKGRRRIQGLWVVRGDMLCEFRKDLGPSSDFPLAKPFMFVAAGEYSVGEALEQAEYLREMQPEPEEPHDLIRDWYKELDEKRQLRAHRSRFGYGGWVQRD